MHRLRLRRQLTPISSRAIFRSPSVNQWKHLRALSSLCLLCLTPINFTQADSVAACCWLAQSSQPLSLCPSLCVSFSFSPHTFCVCRVWRGQVLDSCIFSIFFSVSLSVSVSMSVSVCLSFCLSVSVSLLHTHARTHARTHAHNCYCVSIHEMR